MKKQERHKRFIETWGTLGPKWGINKTMAQIHALLMISDEPLCYHCFQKHLEISVGSINKNLKTLLAWELIYGVDIEGERCEHFVAEKDIWTVFQRIIKHRKDEELKPLLQFLDEISVVESEKDMEEDEAFFTMVQSIKRVAKQTDQMLNTVSNGNNARWIAGLQKLLR